MRFPLCDPFIFHKKTMNTISDDFSESKRWKESPDYESLFAIFSEMTLFETGDIKVSAFNFLSH